MEFAYFGRKLFPKDFLNSPIDFVQVGTTGIRGRIRILLPRVCAFVFLICPTVPHREFPVNRGCLRSGFLEAEPETGIHVQVIYWGSALRGREGRGTRMWSQLESGFSLLLWRGSEHKLHCRVDPSLRQWRQPFEPCIHHSLAPDWPR